MSTHVPFVFASSAYMPGIQMRVFSGCRPDWTLIADPPANRPQFYEQISYDVMDNTFFLETANGEELGRISLLPAYDADNEAGLPCKWVFRYEHDS